MVGNVYLGRVQNVLPGMEAAFVDVGRGRNAVLYAGEVNWSPEDLEGAPPRIEHVLKSGQSVLVQVTKDPIGGKGARLTAQISLPGRFLVLAPNSDVSGISRRLPDAERRRLKAIIKSLKPRCARADRADRGRGRVRGGARRTTSAPAGGVGRRSRSARRRPRRRPSCTRSPSSRFGSCGTCSPTRSTGSSSPTRRAIFGLVDGLPPRRRARGRSRRSDCTRARCRRSRSSTSWSRSTRASTARSGCRRAATS